METPLALSHTINATRDAPRKSWQVTRHDIWSVLRRSAWRWTRDGRWHTSNWYPPSRVWEAMERWWNGWRVVAKALLLLWERVRTAISECATPFVFRRFTLSCHWQWWIPFDFVFTSTLLSASSLFILSAAQEKQEGTELHFLLSLFTRHKMRNHSLNKNEND